MYLRIVQLRVREGQEAGFARFYEERVIPALANADGCLYAGLLAPWRGDAHQSLTIWESDRHAAAYTTGGLFHRLLAEGAPMLTGRDEWRVRPVVDPLETADPGRAEPPSEGWSIEAGDGGDAFDGGGRAFGHPFVRIVALRVAAGRLDEFLAIYRGEVMPALRAVDGCRGVLLAESWDESRALSISLWRREEDAVRYEMSGEFARLTARLRGTFAALHDWGIRLAGTGPGGRPQVTSYEVVRGRRLGEAGDHGEGGDAAAGPRP